MSIIESIHAEIKERIVQEVYLPAQKLSETVLAQEFHCSRTPIRQVLQQLQKENFVTIVPQSGTYVNEIRLRRADIQVRAYLEGLAYRLCLETRKDLSPLLKDLKDLFKIMHTTLISFNEQSMKKYAQYHYHFHEKIILFSENPLLCKLYRELHLTDSPSFIKKSTLEDLANTEKEHLKIIEYLKNRSPEGEDFMISHLYHKKMA